MKELRLEYHRETGVRIQDWCFDKDESDIEEYIEWLEEKLLDDEALFILINKILHEKKTNTTRDKTGEHLHSPDE
jgi:hypothetical protein